MDPLQEIETQRRANELAMELFETVDDLTVRELDQLGLLGVVVALSKWRDSVG